MTETAIKLDTFKDIFDFVKLSSMCSGEVVVCSSTHIVDGKSIMGIYSLDLSKPLKVEFHGDIPKDVREGIQKYIVDQE